MLGMEVFDNLPELVANNWTRILKKLRYSLTRELSRNLNLIQKIWHVNLMALSKIWYLAHILPMPKPVSQRVEISIGYYLWRGCMFRVGRQQLRNDPEEGGLGLIDVNLKCKALFIKSTLRISEYNNRNNNQFSMLQHIRNPNYRRITGTKDFNEVIQAMESLPGTIKDDPNKWNSKSIYGHLRNQQKAIPGIEVKFPNYNWKTIWAFLKTNHIPTDWKTCGYSVINDIIPTEAKKFQHGISTTPNCKSCGKVDNIRHRLTTCPIVQPAWKWISNILRRVAPTGNPNTAMQTLLHLEIDKHHDGFLQRWLALGYIFAVIHEKQHSASKIRIMLLQIWNKIRPHLNEKTKQKFGMIDL